MKLASRLILAVTGSLIALLVVEGAFSLAARRSLRSLFEDEPLALRVQHDEERFAAAARNPGPYRHHPDPRVGYVLKADAELEIIRAAVHSDRLGLRQRPGAEAEPGALRIALVGDSVAFGAGLTDEKTIAHQMETQLAVALPDSHRQVVVRTVAVPGWNFRNSTAFVRDHFDSLRPDIVLYLPIGNDLADTDSVFETGHRRYDHDIRSRHPWVLSPQGALLPLAYRILQEAHRNNRPVIQPHEAGPRAMNTDIGPESRRRFDAQNDAVAGLHDFLSRQGTRLVLLHYHDMPFMWLLRERLVRHDAAIPVIPLLGDLRPEDSLGFDPHPSPDTARYLARWIIEGLAGLGMLPALATDRLPPIPDEFSARRTPSCAADACIEKATAIRASARDRLQGVVDTSTGHGLWQIYGGIGRRREVGPGVLALLPPGERVCITTSALTERPDLYPVTITARVGNEEIGRVVVRGEGQTETTLELPAGARNEPFDLELRPDNWAVVRQGKRSVLGSFVLEKIEVLNATRGSG